MAELPRNNFADEDTLQAVFQRYPQPEKEYQSFSLIYSNRSLDLICKDKDEAEVWLAALRALISRDRSQWRTETRSESVQSDSPCRPALRNSPSNLSCSSSDIIYKDPEDSQTLLVPYENSPQNRLGKAFSEVFSYTAAAKEYNRAESVAKRISLSSPDGLDDTQSIASATDTFRTSVSSAVSSSSKGSFYEDIDNFNDVFIWGEGIGNGLLGGGIHIVGTTTDRMDALLPKALESTAVLDPYNIACGSQHAVLITKQKQLFSWGEGSGGRLGHGDEADVPHPKLIDGLAGSKIELVACGEFHTCAVTVLGDLYTWGDGTRDFCFLGRGSEASYWTPKKLRGQDSPQISFISSGPWHTAFVTSAGQLFTFGDGTFGALGHGDHSSTAVPREVETLKGLRTVRAACGVWHTVAVVEVTMGTSSGCNSSLSGKLYTWGDGDKGQLGHGDKKHRLIPSHVAVSDKTSFCQVACGYIMTIALTTSGQVYTMGSADLGQPCIHESVNKVPIKVEGNIRNRCIEEIACGSHHVAVLSSKAEVYTWGKGTNGQLGHGDNEDRKDPTLVKALKDKQVKKVECGSNFTAVICLHEWMSGADHSICSGCRNPFGFRRKRHNCYNCGLLFCKACSSEKSLKAALAPNNMKPYRVCDDCCTKLKRAIEYGPSLSRSMHQNFSAVSEKGSSKHGSFHRRPASFDSSKLAQSQHSNKGSLSPILNESFQSDSTSKFEKSKIFSASVPRPRMISRAKTHSSRRSSPAYLESMTSVLTNLDDPEIIIDVSNEKEENLSLEINTLRAQAEDLTCKSENLEAELKKTSRQLTEATITAGVEAEKTKAAKGVIRSLAAKCFFKCPKLYSVIGRAIGYKSKIQQQETPQKIQKLPLTSSETQSRPVIFPCLFTTEVGAKSGMYRH
ncbi:Regulator of chromosome condensation (RCC1) family with FYVE zinc finger domain-containing protein [Trema orientale]|uniref:Regulator of chromosome condensation (RCC1) family with FYVE zinc finger domain-containing protein n=1 Tax=Trema orientale TaxID=63057 RepID=A0A2P5F778_TREOI|nr:Regulator of chromosome condensation (RCC1) family with FYVE zinc finger domain-containing protein [Trema orientale]